MNSQENTIYREATKLISKHLEQGYILTGLHSYSTNMNVPIFWRLRLTKQDQKLIFPMHQNENGQFVLKEPDFCGRKKPIYRLPELTQNTYDPVYIVEGEVCCDKLVSIGLLATTSGGWNSAKNADGSLLQGREIVIWYDADNPGVKYAEFVTEILWNILHHQVGKCRQTWST